MENRPEKQISQDNIEADHSKAQDNAPQGKSDVNDGGDDKNYPGYPHYPAQDDLLNPENNSGRVDVNVDDMDPEDRTV